MIKEHAVNLLEFDNLFSRKILDATCAWFLLFVVWWSVVDLNKYGRAVLKVVLAEDGCLIVLFK
jgi:hypothetical protein